MECLFNGVDVYHSFAIRIYNTINMVYCCIYYELDRNSFSLYKRRSI